MTTNTERPARMGWRWALGVLPLLYLWWLLVNQLRVPWSTNPQYAYGWAVPFLCAYLIWQRFQESEGRGQIEHPTSNIQHRTSDGAEGGGRRAEVSSQGSVVRGQ